MLLGQRIVMGWDGMGGTIVSDVVAWKLKLLREMVGPMAAGGPGR
jgi:hypothetical protein